MDNIGEIVLVVLLLAGSILQQILKAAKKSKNKAEAERNRDRSWEERDHPIFPAVESYDAREKNEERYFHYDSVDNSQEFASYNIKPISSIGASIRIDNKENTEITSFSAEDEIADNRITEIMDGFELDKAIIYSELLKPKFKEY